jgi:hypothetical protein
LEIPSFFKIQQPRALARLTMGLGRDKKKNSTRETRTDESTLYTNEDREKRKREGRMEGRR